MSRAPNRLLFKDAKTPYSETFDDVYFANEVGVDESIYVYLEGCGVGDAIRSGKNLITVGEVGFGVGLNFILTLREFLKSASPDQRLHYVSVEKHPIEVEDLWTLYRAYPDLLPFASLVWERYPVLTPGIHRLHFAERKVTLDLLIGDAKECFADHDFKVDHWYWDGFAPSKNPDAFSDDLFTEIEKRSNPGARGTSFTAAGWVRRSLEAHHFQMRKKPGFGKKRECIEGIYTSEPQAPSTPLEPWFQATRFETAVTSQKIAVIGAGLAGTAIARNLADRGFTISLFDPSGVAGGASSNSVGLFNVQLSKQSNPICRYAQTSLTYFLRELIQLKLPHRLGIHRKDADARVSLENAGYPDTFFKSEGGSSVFLSQCGMVNPSKLCHARVEHANIKIHLAKVTKVEPRAQGHELLDETGNSLGAFDHVIFALGEKIDLLPELPVRAIRGQTLLIKPTLLSKKLSDVYVEDGYVTPVDANVTGHEFQILGATYQSKCILPNQIEVDTDALLKGATGKWSFMKDLSPENIDSIKVGFRASTPDKLPLIGPLFEEQQVQYQFRSSLKGGPSKNLEPLEVRKGLWLLMGLGSRGITFSSLGAEILASLIQGQTLPIERSLFAHLHPVRFTVRKLRKN